MKILFIFPKWKKFLESRPELIDSLSGYHIGDFNMPSIGITTVAALTPPEHEVELIDDHLDTINYQTDADLIAITAFTPQATRAYAIADKFRAAGKKVVMGGSHPSLMCEEASDHADTVIVGEAEQTWPVFLKDLKNKSGKKRYSQDQDELPRMLLNQVHPRRDLFEKKGYISMDVIQTARGCPFNCQCCIIPACYGRHMRFRPLREVIDEISSLNCEIFYFADDHLLFGKATYAKKLFQQLIDKGIQKSFYISGSLAMMANDEELLALAQKAGCKQLYTVYGFCQLSKDGLGKKGDNEIYTATKRIINSGIEVFASFGIGFDFHDPGIFDRTLEYADKADIKVAEFFLATPYPETPFMKQLLAEERLIDKTWENYNGSHVVFKPKQMSEDALLSGYISCWKEFYKKYSREKFNREIGLKYYATTAEDYQLEREKIRKERVR
ncbi:MAG: B12-binding domain-containing radical SAM protein [Spirochaetales bacterium]|nr:B12-binding domain-containing radical SAM protein [Spirochaetales bacterium]